MLNAYRRFVQVQQSTKPTHFPYSFIAQESDYSRFRPLWPQTFALNALARADIHSQSRRPVVACIGSGTGADVQPFLNLGCIVYGIEPNAEFRNIALRRFQQEYGDRFISVDGNATNPNLPEGTLVDIIVCAQALHTFSAKATGKHSIEEEARQAWLKILPDDSRARLSIWYYNLDPTQLAAIELDSILKQFNPNYGQSVTPLLNASAIEPSEFLPYIEAHNMSISHAQFISTITLRNQDELLGWLKSYSFFSRIQEADLEEYKPALLALFNKHKNHDGVIEFRFVGFISQGALRKTRYISETDHEAKIIIAKSPISSDSYLGTQSRAEVFEWQDSLSPRPMMKARL